MDVKYKLPAIKIRKNIHLILRTALTPKKNKPITITKMDIGFLSALLIKAMRSIFYFIA
jgi:hypothetical protein